MEHPHTFGCPCSQNYPSRFTHDPAFKTSPSGYRPFPALWNRLPSLAPSVHHFFHNTHLPPSHVHAEPGKLQESGGKGGSDKVLTQARNTEWSGLLELLGQFQSNRGRRDEGGFSEPKPRTPRRPPHLRRPEGVRWHLRAAGEGGAPTQGLLGWAPQKGGKVLLAFPPSSAPRPPPPRSTTHLSEPPRPARAQGAAEGRPPPAGSPRGTGAPGSSPCPASPAQPAIRMHPESARLSRASQSPRVALPRRRRRRDRDPGALPAPSPSSPSPAHQAAPLAPTAPSGRNHFRVRAPLAAASSPPSASPSPLGGGGQLGRRGRTGPARNARKGMGSPGKKMARPGKGVRQETRKSCYSAPLLLQSARD